MSQSPKVDAAELRALVSTLETLIAEASRVTGELKAVLATAEQIEARSVVASTTDRTGAAARGTSDQDRGGNGEQTLGGSQVVRRPAASPWARKRANAAAPGRSGASEIPAAALPSSTKGVDVRRTAVRRTAPPPASVPGSAPSVAAAAPERDAAAAVPPVVAALPDSPSFEIVGAAGGALYGTAPIDPLPGPLPRMTAEPAAPSRETRPAPKLFGTDAAPWTADGDGPAESTPSERSVPLPESLFAAVAHFATTAPPDRSRRRAEDRANTTAPPVDTPGSVRGPADRSAGPALSGQGGRIPGASPETASVAAQYETARPPSPVPPFGESPAELSLPVEMGVSPGPDTAGPRISAGPPGVEPAPRSPAPLQLVGEPHTAESSEVPEMPAARPDPVPTPELPTVLPMARRAGDSEAIRLVRDMARRHGLENRGFETAELDTGIVREIEAALDDLLGKYTVPLYGIEVAEQREDTIRRERKKAPGPGPVDALQVWITLERAELTGPGATGAGQTRRLFRRAGSADRPVYAAVARAFAAALDEAGGYRARQDAWRILMAGSLSGGPDIAGGLLDPRRALIEGFTDFELRGKRAGEPAITLHGALLKMAQAKPEETSA
ncbi:hypothetical protein [Nocardia sp. NBC_01329]|uniref:hypothetical protein n=1 Tax=Nocardia sp. NBC_01329 TaxID=2903594 RepID=UPI002E120703|nr:hypothetical protein OG405_12930 [Nocardia sp. NBC_01329]